MVSYLLQGKGKRLRLLCLGFAIQELEKNALIDLKTEYEKLVVSGMDEIAVFDKTKKITAERLSEIRIMVRKNYQSTINAYEKEKKTVINFILDKIAENEANQLLMVEVDGVERALNTDHFKSVSEGIQIPRDPVEPSPMDEGKKP